MSDFLFTTPDVGEGIAEVELMEWHVEVGQSVEEDTTAVCGDDR